MGLKTASGHRVARSSVFVALPDRSALGREVVVQYKGKTATAPVWDVGPHNVTDPYWRWWGVPAAAQGRRVGPMVKYGRPKNKAGIDLSDALWDLLGIPRKSGIITVTWWFK